MRTLAVVLALALVTPAAPLKVAPISFERLVRQSEAIVIGRVESLEGEANVRLARLRVTRIIAGKLLDECPAFVAEKRWTCDLSTAEAGETLLLFLRPARGSAAPGDRPLDVDKLCRLAGTKELWVISHWGRGRMPVHSVAPDQHVQACSDITELDGWQTPCSVCAWQHRKPLVEVEAEICALLARPEARPGG